MAGDQIRLLEWKASQKRHSFLAHVLFLLSLSTLCLDLCFSQNCTLTPKRYYVPGPLDYDYCCKLGDSGCHRALCADAGLMGPVWAPWPRKCAQWHGVGSISALSVAGNRGIHLLPLLCKGKLIVLRLFGLGFWNAGAPCPLEAHWFCGMCRVAAALSLRSGPCLIPWAELHGLPQPSALSCHCWFHTSGS